MILENTSVFEQKISELKSRKIFFIDVDGTLALGNNIIEGATDFLNKLKEQDKLFFFTTNNSSRTPVDYLKKFSDAGFNIALDNILVSTQAAITYLKEKKIERIYPVANKKVSAYLRDNEFTFDRENPQALLLTYNTEITYEDLETLTHLVRKGIPYYATHSDIVCPTPLGAIPDIGTFIKVIEMTTGKVPHKIFGKPDRNFIKPLVDKYNLTYKDAVMIGDRLYTDIKLAENSVLLSVLVLTGETKREDYEVSEIKADIVVQSVKDLVDFI